MRKIAVRKTIKMVKIAVYGSLRAGCHNYYRQQLDKQKYLGKGFIKGFQLYSLGSYPAMVKSKTSTYDVIVEVYDVDKERMKEIRLLESSYKKHEVGVIMFPKGKVKAKVFVMETYDIFSQEVIGGDWVKYCLSVKNAPIRKEDIK